VTLLPLSQQRTVLFHLRVFWYPSSDVVVSIPRDLRLLSPGSGLSRAEFFSVAVLEKELA